MISISTVAAGLALKVPPLHFGLVALAHVAPLPALAILAGLLVHARRKELASAPSSELLRELSASLRAGLSVRSAVLASGAGRVGERAVRMARLGAPLEEVAGAMRYVPVELVSLLGLAGRVGGSVAGALDVLAAEEDRAAEDRREVRAAAAPMLLQAAVVGGLPVVAVIYRALDGGLMRDISEGGPVAVAAVSGMVSIAAGLWWLARLVKRASR